MSKKAKLTALCLLLMFVLSGCWNYRSLSEIAIAAGMAIDLDPDSGEFLIVCEVIDLSGDVASGGPKTRLVTTKGKTIFDAVRNAKRRLEKKLYFGNMNLIAVSEELAKNGHIEHIYDWLLRDAEMRETAYIVVSQEKTAAELLRTKGINTAIISYEITNIARDDQSVTASTTGSMLYQIFNVYHAEGFHNTIPAFHVVTNEEENIAEANGIAVFKGEQLVGYLTPEESKYFLFVMNEVQGGILTVSQNGEEKDNVSLEISDNKTKHSFKVEDGKLKVTINVEATAYLAEIEGKFDSLDPEMITSLEAAAGAALKNRMEDVIKKVQTEYGSDIFGFGDLIHKKNHKLWAQISNSWDEIFPTLDVTVNAKVSIVNSAYIKDTKQEKDK